MEYCFYTFRKFCKKKLLQHESNEQMQKDNKILLYKHRAILNCAETFNEEKYIAGRYHSNFTNFQQQNSNWLVLIILHIEKSISTVTNTGFHFKCCHGSLNLSISLRSVYFFVIFLSLQFNKLAFTITYFQRNRKSPYK